ncbi:hypothetical protein BDF22DRAFT_688630 [Syncephalis plumigaleata]|nr:hypothetical protein BDF22DRAFT_688630 [Syncephalis plumigaleata]
MQPQYVCGVLVPSNATLCYLRQAITTVSIACIRQRAGLFTAANSHSRQSNNRSTFYTRELEKKQPNESQQPQLQQQRINRHGNDKALNAMQCNHQQMSSNGKRYQYSHTPYHKWFEHTPVTEKQSIERKPVYAVQPPLVLIGSKSTGLYSNVYHHISLQLLADFYRLMATNVEGHRLFSAYQLLRPHHLQAELRRRDFRHLFRRFAKDDSVSVSDTLLLLEDMRVCGITPAISDYQLVMWKACYVHDWHTVGNLWARMHAANLRPDSLGFTVVLRMAAYTSSWLDVEDYLRNDDPYHPLLHHLPELTSLERRRRQRRKYIPHNTYDPNQDTWLRVTEHLLDRMRSINMQWTPEAWAALVMGQAACGNLHSLGRVLKQMHHHAIPCLPYAADAVIRRLISIDLIMADCISARLPNLPARTFGRLMEEFAAIGDYPRFHNVLLRALHHHYIPKPSFIIPLLHRLRAHTTTMSTRHSR